MNEFVKILKLIGLLSLATGALLIFGNLLNGWIPWQYLTDFFIILKHLVNLLSFILDTDTMYKIIGWTFEILSGMVIYNITIVFINWFR